MKSFSQFLLEYRGSRASEKAYRLGLVSNKHGGWLDRSGKLIAKTVNGDLQFIQKKSATPERFEKNVTSTKQADDQRSTTPPEDIDTNSDYKKTKKDTIGTKKLKEITIVLGRFNPPTNAHRRVFDKAIQIASGKELRIYPSRAQNRTTDPLNPPQKIKYMRKMFPDLKENIVNDRSLKTIFDVLQNIYEDGFKKVNIVVGSDRVSEFERLSKQYNNSELYSFDEINVVSAGPRDPDSADDLTSMSAAKLRKAAIEDDFVTFRVGIPRTLPPSEIENLFHAVQNALKGKNKLTEIWKISPELDYDNLRENFYRGNIFKVDQLVQNLNTGLIGKITRRGPNYTICVTEDNKMFKSWIKDITEWTDNSGVPADQRLVGTDSYRKYVMRMTDTKKIKNFIDSYKKSKLKL